MTKKLKIVLIASVLAGSFSCTYAGWFSFAPKSTYEKAQEAYGDEKYIEAVALYEQACNEGNVESCNETGTMYEGGLGIQKDTTKAKEFYLLGCSKGDLNGCNNLNTLRVVERSSSLQEKCNNGNSQACRELAIKSIGGIGGLAIDYGKAAVILAPFCAQEDSEACAHLGRMYMFGGYGLKQNYFKASELSIKGCDSNIAWACSNVGKLYKDGLGVRLDNQKAADFYGKACDMKDQAGCENYKRLKSPQPVQQAVNNHSNSNYQQEQLAIQREQLQQQKNQAASQWLQNIQNQSNTNMQINNMMNSTYKGFDASQKGVNFNR